MEDIKLTVRIDAIGSYKRLSYDVWYAFAEFIDNSTQAYFNNKKTLDDAFSKTGERLTVSIEYDKHNDTIKITDNSIGMTSDELKKALTIGVPPEKNDGRSKYGLGLKTAACWLGNYWTIKTKKLNETYSVKATIDVKNIIESDNQTLPTEYNDNELPENHYTEIVITQLNRQYHGNTLNKVSEFLRTMYRIDFEEYGLVLKWQNEQLEWRNFEDRLYVTHDGKPYKVPLSFTIDDDGNKKRVFGWVGVLAKGSRKEAGFSILQNRRVIKGWPDAYRPASLFGTQDGGSNDLVNQRLTGELYLDDFVVSHQKDQILWQGDEERLIEQALGDKCADARSLAASLRVGKAAAAENSLEKVKKEALALFESELKSDELRDRLFVDDIPPERVITLSYRKLADTVHTSDEPSLRVTIGADGDVLTVLVYLRSVTEFEPYVLIEASTEEHIILIILNLRHPYWQELKNLDGVLDFIRQCVYDGVAEWKARRKTGRLSPDTIKYIKDTLLRLPYEILSNRFDSFRETEQD